MRKGKVKDDARFGVGAKGRTDSPAFGPAPVRQVKGSAG